MVLSRRVLLLNASYEPLGIVSIPRAVRLMWKSSVDVVEYDGDRVLRSPSFEFPVPSVVRLVAFVDVRQRRSKSGGLRTKILMRDRYRCQYCGVRGTGYELTLDHIVPRSRGGRSTPENLCASCKFCNQRKGDRTPDEARMPLLAEPSALLYDLEYAALRHAAISRPEWAKYLEPWVGVSVA